nr:SIR-2.1 [Bursaphelenchus mucronatus]
MNLFYLVSDLQLGNLSKVLQTVTMEQNIDTLEGLNGRKGGPTPSRITESGTGSDEDAPSELPSNLIFEMSHEPSLAWRRRSSPNTKFINDLLAKGISPYQILQSMAPTGCQVPKDLPVEVIFRLLFELMDEKCFRKRLPQYHDFSQAVELFKEAKRILIITGAGVSVSCGIPDFRSSTGIYATLKQKFPDLPQPTAMFDIDFFRRRPEPFFSFAKEIFPGVYQPSISHMFIRFLEEENKLLRNYTQNIDTLERVAGIENVIECHGSFATATCLSCKEKYVSDDIKEDVYAQKVARCRKCLNGVIKPDIVFFGEDLPDKFHSQMGEDIDKVDLVVVIGSSLRVQPVSLIPHHVDPKVPQILINREDLRPYDAEIKLLGDCDEIILALATAMGGTLREKMMNEVRNRKAFLDRLPELEALIDQEKDGGKIALKGDNCQQGSSKNGDDEKDLETLYEEKVNGKGTEVDELIICEKPSSLWETKYIAVASKLKGLMYAKFSPNLNIFKGADFYLDLDAGTLGPLPRRNDQEVFEEEESPPPSSISTPSSSPRPRSLPDETTSNEYRDFTFDDRTTQSLPDFSDSDDGSP